MQALSVATTGVRIAVYLLLPILHTSAAAALPLSEQLLASHRCLAPLSFSSPGATQLRHIKLFKVAGTTFESFLVQLARRKSLRRFSWQKWHNLGSKAKRDAPPDGPPDMVTGHQLFGEVDEHFPEWGRARRVAYVTTLREPIDRAKSQVFWSIKLQGDGHGKPRGSDRKAARRAARAHYQAVTTNPAQLAKEMQSVCHQRHTIRFLCGSNCSGPPAHRLELAKQHLALSFAVVGLISSNHSSTVKLLSHTLGFHFPQAQGPKIYANELKSAPSAAERAAVGDACRDEAELYEFAKRLHELQLGCANDAAARESAGGGARTSRGAVMIDAALSPRNYSDYLQRMFVTAGVATPAMRKNAHARSALSMSTPWPEQQDKKTRRGIFPKTAETVPWAKNMMLHEAHHLQYGGPWLIGRDNFMALVRRGLQPTDTFLEIGCGTLRNGIHLIGYLDAGNYFCIEPDELSLRAGIEYEVPLHGLVHKRPTFLKNRDFEVDKLVRKGFRFDWIFFFSVVNHLQYTHEGPERLQKCMCMMATYLHSKGRIVATHKMIQAPVLRACGLKMQPGELLSSAGILFGMKWWEYTHDQKVKQAQVNTWM